MLQTPKYGWTNITIGDWTDRCSDISGDVPYLLLEAVDYTNRTHRPSSVSLDAEGWEYVIVFHNYEAHIITNDINGEWQYHTVEIPITRLIRDLLADIRKDLNAWSEWGIEKCEDDMEIEERQKDLRVWCDVIERRL